MIEKTWKSSANARSLSCALGVLADGRLVLQDDLSAVHAPTGRVRVRTPDPDRVVGLLDGRVEQRTSGDGGDVLLVRAG